MDKLILQKQIVLDLKKKNNIETKAQVVVAMDHSGSMAHLYNNGFVQKLLDRLLPIALGFDDNETLDFYLFDDNYEELPGVTKDNYANYVEENVGDDMGATNYEPVLNAIYKSKFKTGGFMGFGQKDKGAVDPVLVIFITDGDNYDKEKTTSFIREVSGKGMFIQFVGIGSSSFPYLEKLDTLTGRTLDNCGFFSIGTAELERMGDEALYAKLLNEFPEWYQKAKALNAVK